MKIIDFKKKGNVVRFYLGKDDCTDYWGDDWDDAPWQHNAGPVYNEFIVAHKDIAFPFDFAVLSSEDDYMNNAIAWTKKDMKDRKVPCIIACKIPEDEFDWYYNSFTKVLSFDGVFKFYFGDEMDLEDSICRLLP